MHTTQEWHRNTTLNVSQAQKSRLQATTQSARSAKAHDDSALVNLQATENLHVTLQEKVQNSQQVRRKLEGTIRETQAQIGQTRNTMSETRLEIKSLQEPIAMCATCTSVRKGRPHREHIIDPVAAKLQEHKLALLKSNEALRSHHESEKAVLQDLVDRAARLKEDLKDKTAALRIDVNCLTHDPVYQNSSGVNISSSLMASRASTPTPTMPSSKGMGAFGSYHRHGHRQLSRPSSAGMAMPMTVR